MTYTLVMIRTFNLQDDIGLICEIADMNLEEFASEIPLSKRSLLYAQTGTFSNKTLEKIYSTIYDTGYRLSAAKNELFQELLKADEELFFHGSKYGISEIDCRGSRSDSDFSNGFYCTQRFESASSFVADVRYSSVYVFKASLSELNCLKFDCCLDWMLAISCYRGKLPQYSSHPGIQRILSEINNADVVIAPIADNRMFEVLNQFNAGEITSVQALHSLSASRLGDQFVFKTQKAVNSLVPLDRYYLCDAERNSAISQAKDNENIIQTKLKLAKREFRNQGKYIDELFL